MAEGDRSPLRRNQRSSSGQRGQPRQRSGELRRSRRQVEEERFQRSTRPVAPGSILGPYEQAAQMGQAQIRSAVPSALGTVAGTLGYEDYAREQAEEAAAIQERAAERAPDVMQASDVEGIGDVPRFVGQTLLSQGPNIAATATSAAVGGGAARLGARGLRRIAGRGGAREAAEESTEQAAQRATQAQRGLDRTTQAGAVGGGAAAGAGLVSSEAFPQFVLDEEGEGSVQERSAKALLTSLGGGALETVPVLGAMRRAGLSGAAQRLARDARRRAPSRIARGAASQAGIEAGTEAAQQSLIRGVHSTINDNIEVLDDEGLRELLNASAAGGIVGGATGGVAGGFGALRDHRRQRRQQRGQRQTRRKQRRQSRQAAESSRAAAQTRLQRLMERDPGNAEQWQAMAQQGLDDPDVQRQLAEVDLRFSEALDPRSRVEEFTPQMGAAADQVLSQITGEINELSEGFENLNVEPQRGEDQLTQGEDLETRRRMVRDYDEAIGRAQGVFERAARARENNDPREFVNAVFDGLIDQDIVPTEEMVGSLQQAFEPFGYEVTEMWRNRARERGLDPAQSEGLSMDNLFEGGEFETMSTDDAETTLASEAEGLDRNFESDLEDVEVNRDRISFIGNEKLGEDIRPWMSGEASQRKKNLQAERRRQEAGRPWTPDMNATPLEQQGALKWIEQQRQRFGRTDADDPPTVRETTDDAGERQRTSVRDTVTTPDGFFERVPYSQVVRAEFIDRQRNQVHGRTEQLQEGNERLEGIATTENDLRSGEVSPEATQAWRQQLDQESREAAAQRRAPDNPYDGRLDEPTVREALLEIPERGDYIGRNAQNTEVQQVIKGTRYAGNAGRDRLRSVLERAATGTGQPLTDQQREIARRLTDVAEQRAGIDSDVDRFLAQRGREKAEADAASTNPGRRSNAELLYDPQNPAAYLDNFEVIRRTELPPQLGGGDPTALTESEVDRAITRQHGDRDRREVIRRTREGDLPRGVIPVQEVYMDEAGHEIGREERLVNVMELAKPLQDRPTDEIGAGNRGGTLARVGDIVWESLSSLANRPPPRRRWKINAVSNDRVASSRIDIDFSQIPDNTMVFQLGQYPTGREVTWNEVLRQGAERMKRRVAQLKSQISAYEQKVRESAGDVLQNTEDQNRLDALRDQLQGAQEQLKNARREEKKHQQRTDELATAIVARGGVIHSRHQGKQSSRQMDTDEIAEAYGRLLGDHNADGTQITDELESAARIHLDARSRARAENLARDFDRRDPEQRDEATEDDSALPDAPDRSSMLSDQKQSNDDRINEIDGELANNAPELMNELRQLQQDSRQLLGQMSNIRTEPFERVMKQIPRRTPEQREQINRALEGRDELGEQLREKLERKDEIADQLMEIEGNEALITEQEQLREQNEWIESQQAEQRAAVNAGPPSDQAEQPVDVGDTSQHRRPAVRSGDSPAGDDFDTRPTRRRAPDDMQYTAIGRMARELGDAERGVRAVRRTGNTKQARESYEQHFGRALNDQVRKKAEIVAAAERQRDRFADQLQNQAEEDRIEHIENALITQNIEGVRNRYRQLFGVQLPGNTTADSVRERLRLRRENLSAIEVAGGDPITDPFVQREARQQRQEQEHAQEIREHYTALGYTDEQFRALGPSEKDAVLNTDIPQDTRTTASVPTMVTQAMKSELRDYGFTDEQIRAMRPQEAWSTIRDERVARGIDDEQTPTQADEEVDARGVDVELTADQQRYEDMTNLVQGWAEKLGIQREVTVIDLETAKPFMSDEDIARATRGEFNGFTIQKRRSEEETDTGQRIVDHLLSNAAFIYVNPNMDQRVQIETLAHEMGHVIFQEHIDTLTDSDASQVLNAFNRWLKENGQPESLYRDALSNKKALATLASTTVSTDARTLADLTAEQRKNVLDFEEWFADNVARWLTQSKQPRSVVERFFKSVADSLRQLLSALPRPVQFMANRDVSRFLRDLWAGKRRDEVYTERDAAQAVDQAHADMPLPEQAEREIIEQVDEEVEPNEAERTRDLLNAATHDSTDPHSPGAHMAFRRVYEKLLTPEERKALARVFMQPHVRRKLEELLPDFGLMASIDRGNAKAAVIYGYQHWLDGNILPEDLSPRSHSLFQKLHGKLSDTFGIITRHEQAHQVFEALQNGVIAEREHTSAKMGEGAVQRYRARNRLERVGQRAMMAYEGIAQSLRFVMPAQSQLYMSDNPVLQAFTNEFNPRVGEERVAPTMFESRMNMRGRFHNKINNATRPLTEEQGREALEILQGNPDYALPVEGTPVRTAVDEIRQTLNEMHAYATARGVQMGFIEDYFPWVFDTDVLADHRAEFVNLVAQEKYGTDLAALFNEDVPTTQEGRELLANQVHDVLQQHDGYGDTDMKVQDGNNTPALSAAHQRRLKFLRDKGDESDLRQLSKFFSKDLGGTLSPYVEQIVKRAEWTSRFDSDGSGIQRRFEEARKFGATDKDIELAQKYLNAMMGTHGRELAPILRHMITTVGTWAGEDWSNVRPEKIRGIQGAIMVYQNIRVLGLATLTSVADTGGIITRSGDLNTAFQAFKAGMKEVALGFRHMVRDQGTESQEMFRSELRKLAETMGTIDMHLVNDVLGETYGGLYLQGTARRVNEKFFQVIQLQRWTRFSRIMGLAAAKQFLLKHRGGLYSEHSKRFLEQLNLRDSDILTHEENGDLVVYTDGDRDEMIRQRNELRQQAAASREAGNHTEADQAINEAEAINDDLMRDSRIRTALNRFVDESVMRPNAAHRPIWASHPDAMLLFHLKQFAYTIHNQIVRRILTEAGQGNYVPLMAATSYIPIMMASDLLREMLQYGPDGDPRKEHWDAWDRVKDGVHRSGMTGLGTFLMDAHKDRTQFGGTGLESLAGPTVSQARDIGSVLMNNGNTGDAFVDALPGNALYGDWGFDATQAEERPISEQANMGSGRYYLER